MHEPTWELIREVHAAAKLHALRQALPFAKIRKMTNVRRGQIPSSPPKPTRAVRASRPAATPPQLGAREARPLGQSSVPGHLWPRPGAGGEPDPGHPRGTTDRRPAHDHPNGGPVRGIPGL